LDQLPDRFLDPFVAGFAFRWRTINFSPAKGTFERNSRLSSSLPKTIHLTGQNPLRIILSHFGFAIHFATANQLQKFA